LCNISCNILKPPYPHLFKEIDNSITLNVNSKTTTVKDREIEGAPGAIIGDQKKISYGGKIGKLFGGVAKTPTVTASD